MIKSMTGYGFAQSDDGKSRIVVELKSLNSRYLDVNVRLPRRFGDREIEIRNLLGEKLERGKIALNVDVSAAGENSVAQAYDEERFMLQYAALKKLADRVMAPYEGLFELALNAPDVSEGRLEDRAPSGEAEKIKKVILQAVEECLLFREKEGGAIEDKLGEYIKRIRQYLNDVERHDPARIDRIKSRLRDNMESVFGEKGYDPSRLEQEMLYFIEKLDIHEERTRLHAHLDHFQQVMDGPASNGKKLAFISQEIGREANTIGAKANDTEIQKLVVLMKEELEKVKEQLANIL